MPPAFVIIGASLAGGTAAATLRQDGFDGDVILIGAEPQPPYERPPLSKQYLRGELPFEKALVRPGGFYEQNRIETRFGVACDACRSDRADRDARYRRARALRQAADRDRRPEPPPADSRPGPAERLRSPVGERRGCSSALKLCAGRKAAVIGMGFIGCEVAASLRQKGVDVVSIDPSPDTAVSRPRRTTWGR